MRCNYKWRRDWTHALQSQPCNHDDVHKVAVMLTQGGSSRCRCELWVWCAHKAGCDDDGVFEGSYPHRGCQLMQLAKTGQPDAWDRGPTFSSFESGYITGARALMPLRVRALPPLPHASEGQEHCRRPGQPSVLHGLQSSERSMHVSCYQWYEKILRIGVARTLHVGESCRSQFPRPRRRAPLAVPSSQGRGGAHRHRYGHPNLALHQPLRRLHAQPEHPEQAGALLSGSHLSAVSPCCCISPSIVAARTAVKGFCNCCSSL